MFNYKKAVDILTWLLNKLGGEEYKLTLIKLVYFADKYHLRKYGRTVSGAKYRAIRYGPVASQVLDVADQNEQWLPLESIRYASEKFNTFDSGRRMSAIDKSLNTDTLSESDIEALSFAFENFGGMDRFQLAELTHKYPEWKKYESVLLNYDEPPRSIDMDIRDFLEDVPAGLNPCYSISADEKAFILDIINESEAIDNFFKRS